MSFKRCEESFYLKLAEFVLEHHKNLQYVLMFPTFKEVSGPEFAKVLKKHLQVKTFSHKHFMTELAVALDRLLDRNVRIVGFKSTGKSEIKTSRSHLAILFRRDGSVDIKLSEKGAPKKAIRSTLMADLDLSESESDTDNEGDDDDHQNDNCSKIVQEKADIVSSSSDESDSSGEEESKLMDEDSDSDIEESSLNLESDEERKESNVKKRKNERHQNSEGEDQANLPPKKTLKKKLVESSKGSNPVTGRDKIPLVEREKPTISYSDVTASLNEAREVLTPNLGASKSKVDIGNVRSKYLVWIQKLKNAGSKLEHKLISNQESVLRVLEQQDKLTEVIEENLRLLKQMEENTSSKWGQCKGQCSNHCLQALDSKVKLTRGRKPKKNPKN